MNQTRMIALLCGAISAMLLGGCGGSNASHATISGSVSGLDPSVLDPNPTVTLLDNGTDSITVGNGNFVLPGQLSSNNAYDVTVATQPPGYDCLVSSGSGLINYAGDSVSNVMVSCQADAQVSVNVSGLPVGDSVTAKLVLNNDPVNESYLLPISSNGSTGGPYPFFYAVTAPDAPVLLPLGTVYNVVIYVQPSLTQVCSVAGITVGNNYESGINSGGIVSADPILVAVNCVPVSS
jgi:hypothetical protein